MENTSLKAKLVNGIKLSKSQKKRKERKGGEERSKRRGRSYFETGMATSKSTLQLLAQQPPHAEATLNSL